MVAQSVELDASASQYGTKDLTCCWSSVHVESSERLVLKSAKGPWWQQGGGCTPQPEWRPRGQKEKLSSFWACLSGWDLKVPSTFTVGPPTSVKATKTTPPPCQPDVGNPSLRLSPDDSTVNSWLKKKKKKGLIQGTMSFPFYKWGNWGASWLSRAGVSTMLFTIWPLCLPKIGGMRVPFGFLGFPGIMKGRHQETMQGNKGKCLVLSRRFSALDNDINSRYLCITRCLCYKWKGILIEDEYLSDCADYFIWKIF